jgi:hypothetical protein
VDGRKLVGSAQVRIGGALLQHGSLPLEPSTVEVPGLGFGGITLADLLPAGSPAAQPPALRSRTLFDRVASSLEEAVSSALPGTWSKGQLRCEESEVAKALLPYYESPSWTWRK